MIYSEQTGAYLLCSSPCVPQYLRPLQNIYVSPVQCPRNQLMNTKLRQHTSGVRHVQCTTHSHMMLFCKMTDRFKSEFSR
jgi:hypothetical protein